MITRGKVLITKFCLFMCRAVILAVQGEDILLERSCRFTHDKPGSTAGALLGGGYLMQAVGADKVCSFTTVLLPKGFPRFH